ncbi:MAG: P22 phage major capsid protein family protein, partial [Pseudolabrys sp.]
TVSQAVRGDGRCVGLWHGCSCHLDLAADLSATTGNSAAQRTVHQAMSGSPAITVLGTASTGYLQNLVFHKNAFALAVVPMEKPAGAVDVARKSYKGLSVRVVPYYDGTNDISNYRLDVLYGIKVLDNRLAVRMGGGSATLGNPAT